MHSYTNENIYTALKEDETIIKVTKKIKENGEEAGFDLLTLQVTNFGLDFMAACGTLKRRPFRS